MMWHFCHLMSPNMTQMLFLSLAVQLYCHCCPTLQFLDCPTMLYFRIRPLCCLLAHQCLILGLVHHRLYFPYLLLTSVLVPHRHYHSQIIEILKRVNAPERPQARPAILYLLKKKNAKDLNRTKTRTT